MEIVEVKYQAMNLTTFASFTHLQRNTWHILGSLELNVLKIYILVVFGGNPNSIERKIAISRQWLFLVAVKVDKVFKGMLYNIMNNKCHELSREILYKIPNMYYMESV